MAKLELLGDGLIARDVRIVQVIEQPPALADHHQKSTARAVVLVVALQVPREMVDAFGEQRNLHIGGPSVFLVQLELCNGFRFGFHTRLFTQILEGKS